MYLAPSLFASGDTGFDEVDAFDRGEEGGVSNGHLGIWDRGTGTPVEVSNH